MARMQKTLSLCASKDVAADSGHLAYRFGSPERIELEFPHPGTELSAKRFRYAHYLRAGVDRTEVSFRVGETAYTVFSYFDVDQRPTVSEGVRVVQGGKVSDLHCEGKSVSNWKLLETAVPCDDGNALASCR